MYCKCSHGYNYQVVGLCDNPSKINITSEEPWTQIIVPEVLPLPDCYPDIEDLERIYIDIKIDSVRVIDTPSKITNGVLVPNAEGTTLTGRKLLVEGVICQTIVYTANVCLQSLHSVNFKFPFCTYIVIPNDETPIELTKYCVKSCIEDVYARPLNNRLIFKSVALFLKASKVEVDCCQPAERTAEVTGTIDYTGKDSAIIVTPKLYKSNGAYVGMTSIPVVEGKQASYSFKDLCPGTYTVVFEVDTTKYKVATTPANGTVTVAAGGTGAVAAKITDIS